MFAEFLRPPFSQSVLGGLGSMFAFSPTSLFTLGQQGAWFAPGDSTTLFQDSAGSTPVTAVEQSLGRLSDKSGRTNHAIQVTAGSRPVVSARVNLQIKSEQYDDAAWSKTAAGTGVIPVVTPNAAIAPDGAMTADRIVFDKGAGTTSADQSLIDNASMLTVVGQPTVAFIWLKSATASSYLMRLDLGGISSEGASYPSLITVTPAWQRFELRIASAGTTTRRMILRLRGTFGSDDFADVYVWGAQQENAVVPSAYQRINTETDYNTAGVPTCVKFDGIDDHLTSATGGGGTAGFFFCGAIKRTGAGGALRTIFSDAGSNSGYEVELNAANQLSLSAGNGAAFTPIATAASTTIGATHLLTAWDDGTNLNVQLDSGAVASVARPVVTAGTAGFTLCKDNGAASGYFMGNMYASVYRKDSGLTATDRLQVQRYVAAQAGLVL